MLRHKRVGREMKTFLVYFSHDIDCTLKTFWRMSVTFWGWIFQNWLTGLYRWWYSRVEGMMISNLVSVVYCLVLRFPYEICLCRIKIRKSIECVALKNITSLLRKLHNANFIIFILLNFQWLKNFLLYLKLFIIDIRRDKICRLHFQFKKAWKAF